MNIEKITWDCEGLKIKGEGYIPLDRKLPLPALIICHGIPAKTKSPDDYGYPLLAKRFCQNGFWVLIFNFRGVGVSEGNFDLMGWVRDLEGALYFLSFRPEIDQKKIFLLGFSGGAAVAIYVAAHHPEIAALVSCASPADFQDLIEGQGLSDFLTHCREVGIIRDKHFPPSLAAWRESFQFLQPMNWVNRLPPRPLLLIHGTEDDVVDLSHAVRLHEKAGSIAELYTIEGAGHRLRVDEKAMKKAEDWLIQRAF